MTTGPERLLPHGVAQWWPHFVNAGQVYAVDPFLLAAVCLRESGGGFFLSPQGPGGTGDGGHGRGLMQIDDRSHADFCSQMLPGGIPKWTDPESNIREGARILKAELVAFRGDIHLACCAYNAGRSRVQGAVLKLGPGPKPEAEHAAGDAVTTGKNYGSWVVERYLRFRGGQ